ncbi:sensor histidine kinase [Luethyella okanaganae]|uniref:histidine kinase n=1 Tax=Luethyella okanaganae TaxID=69372 RepID=A0ABW1VGB5_9MICO
MADWLQSDGVATTLFVVGIALALVASVAIALWIRAARELRGSDRDWTGAERTRIDLELSLAEQTARLGIVRELQDVAVHSVSRLITQAEGARYTAESDPSAAVRAVSSVVESGREALGDMRRVLTVAREGESVSATQPGLQSARDLFRVMRDAGLTISFEETGERYDLKPGAELAVFRILQGALANALKHGGTGTETRVSFAWTRDGLQLLVDDDGIRAAARRAGHDPNELSREAAYTIDDDLKALTETITGAGLSQMRQRTELFGGVFKANTVPGVGFSVSAVFPALRFHNGIHGVNLVR